MLNYNRRLLFFLPLILLIACAPKARMSLYFTDASYRVYDQYSPGPGDFQKLAQKKGYQIQWRVLGEDENSTFASDFSIENQEIFFIDPLIRYPAGFFANHDNTLFVTLGKSLEPTQAASVLHLVFDDSKAFEKAGEAAASMVVNKPDSFPEDFVPRWGSLYYSIPGYNDNGYFQFKQAFNRTLESQSTENPLVEEKISSLNDKAKAREIYENLKAKRVNCFFLRGYQLNSFFMTLIATDGHYMALSDWHLKLPLDRQILIKVNHNLWKALETVFDNLESADGKLQWKEQQLLVEPQLIISKALNR